MIDANDELKTTDAAEPADMPPLGSLEETGEAIDLQSDERSDTLIPPPEPDPSDEARKLTKGQSALFVGSDPLVGGAVVPRHDTCWCEDYAPHRNCYVVAGSRLVNGRAMVLCDVYDFGTPSGALGVHELVVHADHFVDGCLVPFNRRPDWSIGPAILLPSNAGWSNTKSEPAESNVTPFGTLIEQVAIELGQSPSQVERVVNGAVQGVLAFLQTKGVFETSPVLGAFVSQLKGSPIVEKFRELFGLVAPLPAEPTDNTNVQQVVDYINKTLEPRIDQLDCAILSLKGRLDEVPPEDESTDSAQADEEDLFDDVDFDEPEVADPEPGPPPRSSKPSEPARRRPGRPVGSRNRKPSKTSQNAETKASKRGPKPASEIGPTGRRKKTGRRGPSIAANKASSLTGAATAVIDDFVKGPGAESVKVRRLLKAIPESNLSRFVNSAKRGVPDFALTKWKIQQQSEFLLWFSKKHGRR